MSDESADVSCTDVLRDVWLFLDDEMDPGRRAVVEHHLADCSPCLDEADLHRRLKHLLSRKCGGDVAPRTLRVSVVSALHRAEIPADQKS